MGSDPTEVLDFEKGGGVVAAIAQDATSGEILMLAWMNPDAFRETLATGRAVYWSRSRRRLWRKGEQSGHVQLVKRVRIDCDGDAILLSVEQQGGAACHTGRRSCFFRERGQDEWIDVGVRVFDPEEVYGR